MVEGSTVMSGSGAVANIITSENSSGSSPIRSSMVVTATQSRAGEEEEKVKVHVRGMKSEFSVRINGHSYT